MKPETVKPEMLKPETLKPDCRPPERLGEFGLIETYFRRACAHSDLGVGDDAALFRLAAGMQLAVSTDMLVAGTHFLPDADAFGLGWKTLAVNVSDLAAMGAKPKWATLALALPAVDTDWLAAFSRGFFACAEQFGVDLVGGDTTRGALTLSVTIMGEVPTGLALRRDAALAGDDIWVSGTLGDAALALAALQGQIALPAAELQAVRMALEQPQPRLTLGLALRGQASNGLASDGLASGRLAHAAIDISDGLLADLGHVLQQSGLGATLHLAQIPRSDSFLRASANQPQARWLGWCLAGGDDYELCFTAAAERRSQILALGQQLQLPLTRIGQTTDAPGLRVLAEDGTAICLTHRGYTHFPA